MQTEEIEEAERHLRRIYPVAEFREATRPFRFEHTRRGDAGVTFARFKFTSRMDIRVEFEEVAGFGLVLGGRFTGESNNAQIDTSRPFLFTPGPAASRSEEMDVLMVNIDSAALARHAAEGLGAEKARLAFRGTAPVSPAMRAHWVRTVGYAWRGVVQEDEVFHNDLVRAATFRAITSVALASFPIEAVPQGRTGGEAAHSPAIRRARVFMEEHPDEALTVGRIAAESRVSVRALQAAFRRELGMTPLAYLRRVRLAQARDALLAADAGEDSVAAIARRWGFTNPGRFAADYRALFGENPATTLRR